MTEDSARSGIKTGFRSRSRNHWVAGIAKPWAFLFLFWLSKKEKNNCRYLSESSRSKASSVLLDLKKTKKGVKLLSRACRGIDAGSQHTLRLKLFKVLNSSQLKMSTRHFLYAAHPTPHTLNKLRSVGRSSRLKMSTGHFLNGAHPIKMECLRRSLEHPRSKS